MNGNGRNNQSPRDLLQRARDYHHRDSLPPKEHEAITDMGAELVNPSLYDSQHFILGSYDTPQKHRLLHLKKEINNWPDKNCRAYLMDDFLDDHPYDVHPMVKFKLIADYSDSIIGICEHDQGGFQLELGMLIAMMDYFEDAHLLKRTYPDGGDREEYNWMLSAGVFDMFDYAGRLWEWETGREYRVEATNIVSTITK